MREQVRVGLVAHGYRRSAAAFASLVLIACAGTRAFDPPPAAALAQISISFERNASGAAVTLQNRSSWDAQYLFPLFACSQSGDLYEDADPRQAARFASADPERDISERALGAGRSVRAELSRAPCVDPAERVGVYFKLARDGIVTYRIVWSAPLGAAPAGSRSARAACCEAGCTGELDRV